MVLLAGHWLAGTTGLIIAAVLSLAMNAGAYFWSDTIALRAMRARPLAHSEAPWLYDMVAELAAAARQPMPRLYVSPIRQPNAFATGRSPHRAAVCVTEGILELLSPRELRAVLGHELAHVYNRDILTSSVAAALAGMITMLADLAWFLPLAGTDEEEEDHGPGLLGGLLMLLLAPIAATLIQLAVSRSREYAADTDGATLSGDPHALASALRKIDSGTRLLPLPADRHQASTAHLMIANPLHGGALAALFSTHPPISQRIARLQQIAHRSARELVHR
ncbi:MULTISPECIES: M48 family metalloprotease [unclassified Micromonospora]|uniref:M48 family metalloprotease n=1 Tax=unclassified Micromonospora TaxID=2617518 RepID=UPI002FF2720F